MTSSDAAQEQPRDPTGYGATIRAFKLMLNAGAAAPRFVQHFTQFGNHGYALTVVEDHVEFLRTIDRSAEAVSKAFDPTVVSRWKTLNQLLVEAYTPPTPPPERLRSEYPSFAALMGFPLLEEISRRVAGMWDEEGILSTDIPESLGLVRINSKGIREPKSFKKGHRIVDLSHKLVVMKSVLSPGFQKTIESLDRRMSMPMIQGVDMPHVTYFERIEYMRNLWLHGRKFEGIEAWLITFFLAMMYYRLPQSSEDQEASDRWAKFRARTQSAQ